MSETTAKCGTVEIGGDKLDLDFTEEDVVKVIDRGGEVIEFHVINGVYHTLVCKAGLIKKIRDFKMRADDIYIPGYPRSGTHWVYEQTSMLLNGKADTIERLKDHLELIDHEKFENMPSSRVINSHMRLVQSPDDVRRKKVKVIYTLRDPKDVAVSHYNMYYGRPFPRLVYKGSFEDFLPLFLSETAIFGNIFDHIRENEKFIEENPDVPVYFHRYEEVMQDPLLSVQKLSDFLGLPRNDDLCRAIADKCHFSKMKVDKEKFAFTMEGENFLYRKGIVGDWRNYFTEKMLDDYYRVYDEKMAGSRFYDLYARDKN